MIDTVADPGLATKSGVAFRIAGIPVLVRWSHLLLVVFITYPAVLIGLQDPGVFLSVTLPVMAMIPLAVLIHELGHALAARAFGGRPRIELVLFGGLTYPDLPGGVTPGRNALVSLAGPVAGIVAGIVAVVVGGMPAGSLVLSPMAMFIWASLGWGVLNLIPLPSLDGGHLLTHTAEAVFGSRGVRWATVIKAVVGVVVVIGAWRWLGTTAALWILIILGPAAVRELQSGWSEPHRQQLATAYAALREQGDFAGAADTARSLLRSSRDDRIRGGASILSLLAAHALGDWSGIDQWSDPEVDVGGFNVLLAQGMLATGQFARAEAIAADVSTSAGRDVLATALAAQGLGHMIEIEPEGTRALIDSALERMRGTDGLGEQLTRALVERDDVPAGIEALGMMQLGRTVPPEIEEALSGDDRWVYEGERAVRAGDPVRFEAVMAESVSLPTAHRLQRRLHSIGAFDSAIELGERALAMADERSRQAIATVLARSLSRGGRPDDALDLIRREIEPSIDMFIDRDLDPVRRLPAYANLGRSDPR